MLNFKPTSYYCLVFWFQISHCIRLLFPKQCNHYNTGIEQLGLGQKRWWWPNSHQVVIRIWVYDTREEKYGDLLLLRIIGNRIMPLLLKLQLQIPPKWFSLEVSYHHRNMSLGEQDMFNETDNFSCYSLEVPKINWMMKSDKKLEADHNCVNMVYILCSKM